MVNSLVVKTFSSDWNQNNPDYFFSPNSGPYQMFLHNLNPPASTVAAVLYVTYTVNGSTSTVPLAMLVP